jgi:type 1 fimbria pilin
MMKKSLILLGIFLFSSLVFAQGYKLGLEIDESFSPGEPISFRVNVLDSQNSVVQGSVEVEIKDEGTGTLIQKSVASGELVTVNLEDDARAGLWSISAVYNEAVVKEFFSIESNEEVKFEIQGDELIIKNIGNSRYTKTIDIAIGNAFSQKKVDLNVQESTRFRLIAPDGTYVVKVTDGKTTFSRANVALTGNVIGIMDKDVAESKGSVTGGLRPGSESLGEETFYDSVRNKSFVYVFILVVVAAAVLLAVERRYRSV